MPDKKRRHFLILELVTETEQAPIDVQYSLIHCIDKDELESRGLAIVSSSPTNAIPDNSIEKHGKMRTETKSNALNGLREIASRSTGAMGKIYGIMKGRPWWHVYVGFCALVLGGTLAWKWLIRGLAALF